MSPSVPLCLLPGVPGPGFSHRFGVVSRANGFQGARSSVLSLSLQELRRSSSPARQPDSGPWVGLIPAPPVATAAEEEDEEEEEEEDPQGPACPQYRSLLRSLSRGASSGSIGVPSVQGLLTTNPLRVPFTRGYKKLSWVRS